MKRVFTATAILFACYCIAATPATKPSADHWFDRAHGDLAGARGKPWDHVPTESELCIMLVCLRGNEQDRALLAAHVPALKPRLVREWADRPDVQDRLVAEVLCLDAQIKLVLRDPAAGQAVDDALTEVDRLEDNLRRMLRSNLSDHLALTGQYDRARAVALTQEPLSISSRIAFWLAEGDHVELHERALRDAFEHVPDDPPRERDAALRSLAGSHAARMMFEPAFQVAQQIQDYAERTSAFARIGEEAIEFRQRQNAARAVKQVLTLPAPGATEAHVHLARIAAQIGDRESFLALADLAARQLKDREFGEDAHVLAQGYAIFGMRDWHQRLVESTTRAFRARRGLLKREAMLSLAASYVFLNEDDRVFDAIRGANLKSDEVGRNDGFWTIFDAYLEHGRTDAARRLVETWVPQGERRFLHINLARAMAMNGELDQARKIVDRLDPGANEMKALHALARAYARAGRFADAERWIDGFQSPLTRATLNVGIAELLLGRSTFYTRFFYRD